MDVLHYCGFFRQMEHPDEEDQHEGGDRESSRFEQLRSIIGSTRALVEKLGLPGLVLLNGVRFTSVSVLAGTFWPGDTREKLFAGLYAGVMVSITSFTFWSLVTLLGKRFVWDRWRVKK